jgi:hypothetical protein
MTPEYVIVFSFFKSCMERGRKAVGVVVYMIVAVLRSYIHSYTLNGKDENTTYNSLPFSLPKICTLPSLWYTIPDSVVRAVGKSSS